MSEAAVDPYAVLGVAPDVSDIELRRVYRGLVKRHHPDHNGGSAESARRFAQIQNAYAVIAQRRRGPDAGEQGPADAAIDDRLASIEREMEAMRAAERERLAREQSARLAAAQRLRASQAQRPQRPRPTPEELGYFTTDDSFSKIVDDAAEQLGERLRRSEAKKQFTRRLSDLFGRDG